MNLDNIILYGDEEEQKILKESLEKLPKETFTPEDIVGIANLRCKEGDVCAYIEGNYSMNLPINSKSPEIIRDEKSIQITFHYAETNYTFISNNKKP